LQLRPLLSRRPKSKPGSTLSLTSASSTEPAKGDSSIHDSTVEPHLGIGHHLHRHDERLFYILAGELDHDDKRNDIQGHMGAGDVGLFTEG
jgi:redox-sensitive bicupin YhaK (pirin superfamily)